MPRGVKALRLIRLIKLLSLTRLERRIKALEEYHGGVFRVFVILVKLLVILFMSAHWMCCIWFFVGFPDGWVVHQDMVDEFSGLLSTSMFHAWITSFYWSITTMTTIGYGDISAGTSSERTLAVFAMSLGCGLFAWTTGQITHTLTSSSQCSARFREAVLEIEEFIQSRGVSMELRDQIMAFYQLKFPSQRIFNEIEIMKGLPRELNCKLMLELFDDMMQLAPLFAACTQDTQRELCYRLRSYNTTEGIQVTTEGEVPEYLYIVRLGSVKVTRKGDELAILSRGDIFGENALLGWSFDGKRNRSVTALTMCDLCVLAADDVSHMLKHHNSFYWAVRKIIDAHSARLRLHCSTGRPVAHSDIYMIDWTEFGQKLIEEEERLRKLRSQSLDQAYSLINLERKSMNRDSASFSWLTPRSGPAQHHFLCTRIRVQCTDLRTSVSPDAIRPGQKVACVANWKGIEGIPQSAVKAESALVLLTIGRDGMASLQVSVDLNVFHENNTWPQLGRAELRIVAYGVDHSAAEREMMNKTPPPNAEAGFEKIVARNRKLEKTRSIVGGGGGFGDTPRKTETPRTPGSGTHHEVLVPGDVLWQGSIDLAELVSNRMLDTKAVKRQPRIPIRMSYMVWCVWVTRSDVALRVCACGSVCVWWCKRIMSRAITTWAHLSCSSLFSLFSTLPASLLSHPPVPSNSSDLPFAHPGL